MVEIVTDADVLLKTRLRLRFRSLMAAIADAQETRFEECAPELSLLLDLLEPSHGPLRGLSLELDTSIDEPQYVDWQKVDSGESIFRVNSRVVSKFVEVYGQSIDERVAARLWHFDLFVVHEIFHSFQGMDRGRHRGLARSFPEILMNLDYEADSAAVVALLHLVRCSPKNFFNDIFVADAIQETASNPLFLAANQIANVMIPFPIGDVVPLVMSEGAGLYKSIRNDAFPRWGTISNILSAQFWHLAVFTADMVDTASGRNAPEESLRIASQRLWGMQKFNRSFAWLLQWYRALYFRPSGRFQELQVRRVPKIEVRNLTRASSVERSFLRRDWPQRENAFFELTRQWDGPHSDAIAISVVGNYGFQRVIRFSPSDGVQALFDAIFCSNPSTAKEFFEELFQENPWLIGYYDDPVRGLPATDVPSTITQNADTEADQHGISKLV